jgi:hypothetical protein
LYHIVLIIVIEYKQLECKEYKKVRNQTFVSAWNVCLLHFGQYFLILSLSFLLFSFVV